MRHLLNSNRRYVRMIAENLEMDKMVVHKVIAEDEEDLRQACPKSFYGLAKTKP